MEEINILRAKRVKDAKKVTVPTRTPSQRLRMEAETVIFFEYINTHRIHPQDNFAEVTDTLREFGKYGSEQF